MRMSSVHPSWGHQDIDIRTHVWLLPVMLRAGGHVDQVHRCWGSGDDWGSSTFDEAIELLHLSAMPGGGVIYSFPQVTYLICHTRDRSNNGQMSHN